jgi:hypothetical protein
VLAYALTYHKMQGKTIETPMILMANTGMGNSSGANMAYTGITRATRIENIAILCDKAPSDRLFCAGNDLLSKIFYADRAALAFYDGLRTPTALSSWPAAAPGVAPGACVCCGGGVDAMLLFRPCMHAVACQACTATVRAENKGTRLSCVHCGAAVLEMLAIAPRVNM